MFAVTVRSALLALCFSAITVSANPAISLSVSGPSDAFNVENFKVIATLTNTGDETLKLLNDPRTALSNVPTDTFSITGDSGASPVFTGVKVKYVPEAVAAKNSSSSFTTLAPGESIEVEHDLSSAYNFTSVGEGKFDIEVSNVLRYIDPATQEPANIYADTTAHTASLTGRLAAVDKRFNKRISYVGCSASRQSTLVTAAANAQSIADSSYTYLQGISAATTRYTTWFGTFTTSRYNTVRSHFSAISSNKFSTYTYDCSSCTLADAYAYVYADSYGTIYLCPYFWSAPATGTDSKAGTLVHESSHFTRVAGTDDHVYGQTRAKSLATSNPAQAITNADNHEYFAENTPALA